MDINLKQIIKDGGMKYFDKSKYEKPVEIVEPKSVVIQDPTIAPTQSLTSEVVWGEYVNGLMIVYSENSLITEEESINESILQTNSKNDSIRENGKLHKRKQSLNKSSTKSS